MTFSCDVGIKNSLKFINDSMALNLITSIAAYYVPVIIMCFLYYKVSFKQNRADVV